MVRLRNSLTECVPGVAKDDRGLSLSVAALVDVGCRVLCPTFTS
jgi:hypothetical protein